MDQATRRILEGEDVDRVLAETSRVVEGATTIYYDFYSHRTGINNRAGWCSECQTATVKEGRCTRCSRSVPTHGSC